MRFHIRVTTADIASGLRASPCRCPIALAICRATGLSGEVGGIGEIEVDAGGLFVRLALDASVSGDFRRASKPLPCVAAAWLEDFDEGMEVMGEVEFDLGVYGWCLNRKAS